jgi:hypothetical protein
MYELPLEVLLRVAYFADLDTLLNLLRIEEFRKSVGSFFNIVVENSTKSSYFEEFSDLRHLSLQAMAERFTNNNDINLIEISKSNSYVPCDLARLLPKGSRNIIVDSFHTCLDSIYNVSSSITVVVVVVKRHKDDWFTISLQDSYLYPWNYRTERERKHQMSFHKIKLNSVKNLVLTGIGWIFELESQNLFAPMLERLSIDRCHEGILKIFSDEVLKNQLTYLKVGSSSVDPSRKGQFSNITNFKNLVSARFSDIDNMKNVRFEKLKRVTISLRCPSRDGKLSVLENVEFPELEQLELRCDYCHGYHHEIKNLQAPKLKLFSLSRPGPSERNLSLSSMMNFWDADSWKIHSIPADIFRSSETILHIRHLSIQCGDGRVEELGANLPRLRELEIYIDSHSKEFPKFAKVPNLKKLRVSLGVRAVGGFFSHIGKYYSHVQYLELYRSEIGSKPIDLPYRSAGFATFPNLKMLHIDRVFRRGGIDTAKLPWRFPNLEELKYYYADGNLSATLTMDFDLPKLRSLTYVLRTFTHQDFSPCLTIRNCPVLQSVELRGVSTVTIYDLFRSTHYSSVLERDQTSTLRFNKGRALTGLNKELLNSTTTQNDHFGRPTDRQCCRII